MVKEWNIEDIHLNLESDLDDESKIYIYFKSDRSGILYGKDLKELIQHHQVRKPLAVRRSAVSQMLRFGTVVPPETIYSHIAVLSSGARAIFRTCSNSIVWEILPPLNNTSAYANNGSKDPDFEIIYKMISKSISNKTAKSRPNFLFHSAGKDSNVIALALSSSGLIPSTGFVCFRSEGDADETDISKSIARRLGANHTIISLPKSFGPEQIRHIQHHYCNSPLPCLDNSSLAYPLGASVFSELCGANIIDGLGNDSYFGHVLSLRQEVGITYSRMSPASRTRLGRRCFDRGAAMVLSRQATDWIGLSGLSERMIRKLLPGIEETYSEAIESFEKLDSWEMTSRIKSKVLSPHVYTLKLQNFTAAHSGNAIFPWKDPALANYCRDIKLEARVDISGRRSKVCIRRHLKDVLELDSDLLGKKGFAVDARTVLEPNVIFVRREILSSTLWKSQDAAYVFDELYALSTTRGWAGRIAWRWIMRLFLTSLWWNYCDVGMYVSDE